MEAKCDNVGLTVVQISWPQNRTRTSGTFTSNLGFQANSEVCHLHTLNRSHNATDAQRISRMTRPLKKTQSSLLKRLLKTSKNVTFGSRPCILLDGRIVPEQAGALGGLQWRPFLGTNLLEGLGTGCSASCSCL